MSRRRTARRSSLLAAIDRESRRTGSVGAMHAKAIASRAGVHSTDFECMDVLDWTGPITAGELARRVGVTSGAITGAIDRLERDGWVRRRSDPDDRRRVIVELCADPSAGRTQAMMAWFAPLVAEIDEINDRFTDEQLDAILAWLVAANDAVERSTTRLRTPPP